MRKLQIQSLGCCLLSLWLTACGDDSKRAPGEPEGLRISIAGTASVHPDASAWLNSTGRPATAIAGLTAQAEEPLGVALGDSAAAYGTQTLAADGAYSIADVPADEITLGIGIRICDPAPSARRVVCASTLAYDVNGERSKPFEDVSGTKAFAVPSAFLQQLTTAVGEGTIQGVAQDDGTTNLESAGFVLGKIVDAQGAGVPGVTVKPNKAAFAAQIFYPTAAFTGTQAGTAASGLFILVNKGGGEVSLVGLGVEGHSEYLEHSVGVAAGSGLLLTIAPAPATP